MTNETETLRAKLEAAEIVIQTAIEATGGEIPYGQLPDEIAELRRLLAEAQESIARFAKVTEDYEQKLSVTEALVVEERACRARDCEEYRIALGQYLDAQRNTQRVIDAQDAEITQLRGGLSALRRERESAEPVARITYSNWNGMNVETLPTYPAILPVGTLLYAHPPAAQPAPAVPASAAPLTCPLCGDTDFDALGLQLHLTRGGCDEYDGIDCAKELTKAEANLCRQWFDSVQDVSPAYLEVADYKLARDLYCALGMRVPNSIAEHVDGKG